MKSVLKSNTEFETASEILKNHYRELYEAVQNDGYTIQYEDYDVFCEIEDHGETAGFFTYEHDGETISVNEIFIIKSRRGRGLAIDALMDFFTISNGMIHIRNPNARLIRSLVKNGYAVKITENIIFSYLPILVTSDDLYTNSKIRKLYRNPQKTEFVSAAFWDDGLKCTVDMPDEDTSLRKNNHLMLFEPRKDDLKKYKLRKKLKKVTPAFLDSRLEEIVLSLEKAEQFADETSEKLGKTMSFGDLNKEDLIKNAENIDLNPKYLPIRLEYLKKNPDMIKKEVDMSLYPDKCPYCESKISPEYADCPVCAYHLKDESMADVINIDGSDRLYSEVMDKIRENGWDEDEIYRLQCLSGTYEYIMMTQDGMYLPIEETDMANRLKSGSVLDYALENGYLRELLYDEYISLIENEYSKIQIAKELIHLDLGLRLTRRGLIKKIKKSGKQSFHYIETEKGMELLNSCEILEFYMQNLRTFLFCEFRKFTDTFEGTLEEAGDAFTLAEFEKGKRNKDWRAYKKLLKYRIARTDDNREHLKLAIQTLIYDLNSDDTDIPDGADCEIDTLLYLTEALDEKNCDTEEVFKEAYDGFEVKELKGRREKAREIVEGIESGEYLKHLEKSLR